MAGSMRRRLKRLNELAAQIEELAAEEKRRGEEAKEWLIQKLNQLSERLSKQLSKAERAMTEEEREAQEREAAARREAREREAAEAFPDLWEAGRRGEALARLVEAETEAQAQAAEEAGSPAMATLLRITGKLSAAEHRQEGGGDGDENAGPETG